MTLGILDLFDITNYSNDELIVAITKNGLAIRYVTDQTPEMQCAAVIV